MTLKRALVLGLVQLCACDNDKDSYDDGYAAGEAAGYEKGWDEAQTALDELDARVSVLEDAGGSDLEDRVGSLEVGTSETDSRLSALEAWEPNAIELSIGEDSYDSWNAIDDPDIRDQSRLIAPVTIDTSSGELLVTFDGYMGVNADGSYTAVEIYIGVDGVWEDEPCGMHWGSTSSYHWNFEGTCVQYLSLDPGEHEIHVGAKCSGNRCFVAHGGAIGVNNYPDSVLLVREL